MNPLFIGATLLTGMNIQDHFTESEWRSLESYYQDKQVVITGGCGFIGSHLAEHLITLGARVTIIDNLSTGIEENIAKFKDQVTFVEGDICDRNIRDIMEGKDHVFHLAAFISVPLSVEQPEECFITNNIGTFNMLEAARMHKVKRFIFSSTCAVYGTYDGLCSESAPTSPIAPYGFSKLDGESLCKQYMKTYGLETVALRYFNVYGPRQSIGGPYSAVIATFSKKMKNKEHITVFGDGTQTRDYVSVYDVVRANLFAGMLEEEKVNGKVFNVGSGKSISVLDLIEELKKIYPNYNQPISFTDPRPGDVKHVRSQCDKFHELMY